MTHKSGLFPSLKGKIFHMMVICNCDFEPGNQICSSCHYQWLLMMASFSESKIHILLHFKSLNMYYAKIVYSGSSKCSLLISNLSFNWLCRPFSIQFSIL